MSAAPTTARTSATVPFDEAWTHVGTVNVFHEPERTRYVIRHADASVRVEGEIEPNGDVDAVLLRHSLRRSDWRSMSAGYDVPAPKGFDGSMVLEPVYLDTAFVYERDWSAAPGAVETCDYCNEPGCHWERHPEARADAAAWKREEHRAEFPFGDYRPTY